MRINFNKLLAITFIWLLFAGVQAQPTINKSSKIPPHPRILLLEGEESLIKHNINTDPIWKEMHELIIASSGEILLQPALERIQTGRRLLDVSRECLRRVFQLSYAWRLTGDEKYMKRAEKELIAVSNFTDWNPSHFLDVAEMTMAVAIGYDWLFPALSEGSKKTIREAIRKKGIEPSLDSRSNGWLKATHNWNQVCNTGITYGVLATFEDDPELSAQLINRAVLSIPLSMEDYKPDGAYPEGYGYWGYGTSFNVMFISAIEKVFGSDFGLSAQPGFLKTAGYLENMTGPTGKCFNYSDCSAGGGLNPAMFWFANKNSDFSLLWQEKLFLKNAKKPGRDRLLPSIMIWGAGITMDKITEPKSLLWTGGGKNQVALMRSAWNDSNAIYIGLKAGSPSVNHGHMDVGSFVMDALGERWAMDFGMQDYNSLESKGIALWGMTQNSQRWQVFRYNNLAHNTLTVNGEFQKVDGSCTIESYTANPVFLSATTNITEVYKGLLSEAKRGVAIVDKSYVIVRDELTSTMDKTTVRWSMATPADVKITGEGTAELTKNGKKLLLKVQEPAKVKVTTWSTTPVNDYDAPNPGTTIVGFEIILPANQKQSVSVLLLPQEKTGINIKAIKPLNEWSL